MTNEELAIQIKAGIDTTEHMLALWQQNRNFIHVIAMHYQGYAELEDLEQEGYLALYHAVNGFDPTRHYSFLTYAKYWITQRMKRYIENCSGTVRVPVYEQENYRKYQTFSYQFQMVYGRKPTRREAAAYLGMSIWQIGKLEKNGNMKQIQSLDTYVTEENDITLGDLVSSKENIEASILDRMEQEELQHVLWSMVDALPGEQPKVLHMKYQERKSRKDISTTLGVKPEQVRLMEEKALKELRKSGNRAILDTFLPEAVGSRAYSGGVAAFQRTWTSSTEFVALKLYDLDCFGIVSK